MTFLSFPSARDQGLPSSDREVRPRIAIALQGGGSWGSFTNGVLQEILPLLTEKGDIVAVSGTSAGAVNGALLVKGLNENGPTEAQKRLQAGWKEIRNYGSIFGLPFYRNLSIFPDQQWPNIPSHLLFASDIMRAFTLPGMPTRLLRQIVDNNIRDWSSLREGSTQLYVNAVSRNLETGEEEHEVFTGKTLSSDAIAASAALREMGGHYMGNQSPLRFWFNNSARAYYDGAYAINPYIPPLLKHNPTDLIVIILHRPESKEGNGAAAAKDKLYTEEIHDDLFSLYLDEGHILNIHTIEMQAPSNWTETSRMNSDPAFLDILEEMGRKAGQEWLQNKSHMLGQNSTYCPDTYLRQRRQQRPKLKAA